MTAPPSRRRATVHRLLKSPEPSIRWRVRVRALGEKPSSRRIRELEREVRGSRLVARLLTRRDAPARSPMAGIYRYWQGSHWALAALADIGYPAGDAQIRPMLDRALDAWSQNYYDRVFRATSQTVRTWGRGVPFYRGLYRRCASQQGNALFYASRLATPDVRAEHLVRLLAKWQWPDGGWNCSKASDAHVSSFMETLTPLRGLAAYAAATGSARAERAARRATEVFLERRMFRRRQNGHVMRARFLQLHYPLYWYYDVLGGLKAIAEAGRIEDPRCAEALDWLEQRELPSGGWPADARFYRLARTYEFGGEYVDWGAPAAGRANDWVTTDALHVLGVAGRLGI